MFSQICVVIMWRLLSVVLVISYCYVDSAPGSIELTCNEEVDQLLQDGNAALTGKFLYEAVKAKSNESAIMSAFSVFTPLAELALYADRDTLSQLLKALNLPDKPHIRCVFPRLVSKLRAERHVALNVASRIFASDNHPLSRNFLTDTKQVFDAEAENVNFLEAEAAANRINQWVEGETNKRIKNLASPDMFDQDTRLVLANAIYFLGNWGRPFNVGETSDKPFHINNEKSVNIPTMYQKDHFKYGKNSNLDCKVLEMYYKGGNFSFVIFLPNKIDGLLEMVEKLQDSTKFYEAYDRMGYSKVHVYIPRIKIESEYDLIPILSSIGITDIFDESKSLLTGILKNDVPLFVSAAKQKAFGLVDEKGTEAAAANVFAMAEVAMMIINEPVYYFEADHPFAFYIMNNRNIIFSGIFAN